MRTQITEAWASFLSVNFPLSLIPADCRVNHMFYVGSRALVLLCSWEEIHTSFAIPVLPYSSPLFVYFLSDAKSKYTENKTDLPSQ